MPRPVRLGLILVPLVAGLAVGGWFLYQRLRPADPQPVVPDTNPGPKSPAGPSTPPTGKLVVLAVFDHLRGEDVNRWAAAFGPDGFERIKKEGVWYADCHIPYASTFSAPGHASIITGVLPAVHGVVADQWYDRAAGTVVGPDRRPELTAPTLAGKGRIVSLALKPDTAVLLGGSRAAIAYAFDTKLGQFTPATTGRDSIHSWAEEFNRSGAVNRQLGKKWEPLGPANDTRFGLTSDITGKGFGSGQGRVFPHPFGEPAGAAGPGYYAAVAGSPFGNELLAELAVKAIAAEKLGKGPDADFLCLGFSATDRIAREWGPDSPELFDAAVRADRLLADLMRSLEAAVGRGGYVLVVTAAHGTAAIPEQSVARERWPAAKRLKPAPLFTRLARALDDTFGPPPNGAAGWFEPAADAAKVWPWVYLNRAAIEGRGLSPDRVARYAAEWLGNRPEMLVGFARADFETGKPPTAGAGREVDVRALFEAAKHSFHPGRSGDVVVIPKPGVVVTADETGTMPGTPHSYDSHVPLLVVGPGVPQTGRQPGRVSSMATAPILARALGAPPPPGANEPLPPGFKK
jgi:hypothetical protein